MKLGVVLSFLYELHRYVKVWSKIQGAAPYISSYFKFVSCDTSPKKGLEIYLQ